MFVVFFCFLFCLVTYEHLSTSCLGHVMSCNLSFIFDCPIICEGPGGSMSQVVGLPNNSFKPITNTAWVRARLCKLQKGCTRLAVASDKVYPLLAQGRWFSPDTPASSTTKTGRHDIAEILLKVALNTKNKKQIIKNQPIIYETVKYTAQSNHSSWHLLGFDT